MAGVSTVLVYLALAGAVASWIAGVVFAARAGAGATSLVWPFAIGRIRAAGGEPAANVNKAHGRLRRLPAGRLRGVLGVRQPSSFREIELSHAG